MNFGLNLINVMFKKGTKVTLKTNLVRKKYYGILPYFEDLEVWQGREMTIQKSYIKEDCIMYLVDENNYTWAEEMIMEELQWTMQCHINGVKEHTMRYQTKYEGKYIFMSRTTNMSNYKSRVSFSSMIDKEVFDSLEELLEHIADASKTEIVDDFDCQGCEESGFTEEELTDCKNCGRSCCKDCIIDKIDLCLDCANEEVNDG